MTFNLRNVLLSAVAISFTSIAPSLALSITDVYPGDLNTIDLQDLQGSTLFVDETYGETHTIPFPSHDGSAIVALNNGNIQWFDKILTLTADDLANTNPNTLFFTVTNNTSYHWSDYHLEFYNPNFTQRIAFPSFAAWDQGTTIGFTNGEAVLGGTVVATSTTGNLPSSGIGTTVSADGFNFYGTPGVSPGDIFTTFLNLNGADLISAGVCTAGQPCDIGIRQIATTSVPEPSSMLGLLALGVVGIGATLKTQKNSLR